jgi:hypothetical protein
VFWSHVALLHQPLLLDPTDINVDLQREHQLVFLHEALGAWAWTAVPAAVLVEVILCLFLWRWLSGMDSANPSS